MQHKRPPVPVIILVLLAGQIYKKLHTLDSAELNVLKG